MQFKVSAATGKKQLTVSADRFKIVDRWMDPAGTIGVYFYNDAITPHWYKKDEKSEFLVSYLPGNDWIVESDSAAL